MKGDFTRSTFSKEKHYRKVNMQQGRVQIDADWNEQNDIQFHREKKFLCDLIGKNGTLVENNGFEILPNFEVPWKDIADPDKNKDFRKFLRENFSLLWIKDDSEFIGDHANSYQVVAGNNNHTVTITRDIVAGIASLVVDGNHIYDFYYSSDEDTLYTIGFRVGKSQIEGKEKSDSGNYYVDGILCENEYTVDASRQPDLQIHNVKFFIVRWESVPSSSRALAYLLQELLPSFGHELPSNLTGELEFTINPANENEIVVSSSSGSTKITLDKTNGKAILEYGSDPIELVAEESKEPTATGNKVYDIYYRVPNPAVPSKPSAGSTLNYLAYLGVSDKHVTHIEDSYIREEALGGVDTGTRTKTAWQVKLIKIDEPSFEKDQCGLWEWVSSKLDKMHSTGKLRARVKPTEIPEDKCSVYETAGYQKLENQLYRVEVHNSGKLGKATFKWSRDNGIVVSKILEFKPSENKLVIESRGRDDNLDYHIDDWIEITDDLHEDLGIPGTFVKVRDIDGTTIEYYPETTIGISTRDENFIHNPKARRWDSTSSANNGAIITPDIGSGYIDLEYGIQIQLVKDPAAEKDGGDFYKTGDYWLIPARTKSGEVEWPKVGDKPDDDALALSPSGVICHYAPLALVKHNDDGIFSNIVDARNFFSSLIELVAIHYVGGDGQEALPNNKLPAPLRVGVTIGRTPLTDLQIRGVKVRFSVVSGGGTLVNDTSAGSSVDVSPNDEGVAECNWDLTDAQQEQQVTAELYICESKIDIQPIHFTATLPVIFYYIQGDGQEAVPGNDIKLQVGLKIGSTTIPTGPSGYQVKFVPTNGSVTTSELVSFNGDGIAETTWTVGHNFFDQHVAATLYYENKETNLQKIRFNARLPLSFYSIRGDGERALPGDKVQIEAGVRVKSDIQLPDDIEFQIRFSITEGSGGSLDDPMIDAISPAADNTYASAKTTWTLGYDDMLMRQQAKAELYFSRKVPTAGPSWIPTNVPPIFFNATLPLSFYYIEGDGVEAPSGTEVRLAVGLALGSKPVKQGYSVRFTILLDVAGFEPQHVSAQLNDDGIAVLRYRLGGELEKHQIKAQLMLDGEEQGILTNFNPIYFNLRRLEKITASANTGLVELILRGNPDSQRTLQYGPFNHYLQDLEVPPALILGRATDDPSNPIPHTEDYALKSGDWHFKPVRITTTTFNIELWFPTPPSTTPRPLLLRWWAIPAQEQKREEPREPIRAIPTIVFDSQSYPVAGPVKVTVTDADANRSANDEDQINITVRSSIDPPASMNVRCQERGPNTGIFVGMFETSGSPVAGKLHVRQGVFISAEYLGASGQDRVTARATVRLINP